VVAEPSISPFGSQAARRHRDPPGPGAALLRSWPREDRASQPKPRCGRVEPERCRCCRLSRRRLPGRRCPFLYLNLLDVGVANGDVVLLVLKDNEPGFPVPVYGSGLVGTVRPRYPHNFAFKRGQDVLPPPASVFVPHQPSLSLPAVSGLQARPMPSSPTFITVKSRASWSTSRSGGR
jgi:hypothetical protein